MPHSRHALRTASRHVQTLESGAEPHATTDHSGARGSVDVVSARTRIAVYGCEREEAAVFREVAPRFGVTPTVTELAVSETNVELAAGHPCISISHKTHVTHSTLRSLSEAGVAYISTRSTGQNHIDARFALSVGITVEGVVYSPDSVADYTLMLMLMLVRNARSTVIRAEAHDFRLNDTRGKELRDMTVGVVGTGRIGAAVIERLRGFGCRVLACDRTPKTSAQYVPLDELLSQSDLVTFHTPLSAQTKHLLSHERIGRMKPGTFIVNTGRGALLDTESVVSALKSGRVGGAALDVLEGEEGLFYTDRRNRPIDGTLLARLQQLPNVLITPHAAFYTEHALHDTVTNTILNCLAFEGGQHA